MKKYCVLYNPQAGNRNGEKEAKTLENVLEGELAYTDVTKIENYGEFFSELGEEEVIICGGDGTLNRFTNAIKGVAGAHKLYYYACGSGNDFLRDVGGQNEKLIELENHVKNLPVVTVKGKDYYFLNGVGYGIDGYCCEKGDKIRATSSKPINYASIAIKGLLFHFKPVNATVIVDGKEYKFKKVWLAPTMNGRFYGGGMLPAPEQTREKDTLSVMLFHGSGKLKSLMIFPSLFKGEHVKKKKNICVLSGHTITVKFDSPRALQIDGETILDVSEYTARK